jgi:hypothetical protein
MRITKAHDAAIAICLGDGRNGSFEIAAAGGVQLSSFGVLGFDGSSGLFSGFFSSFGCHSIRGKNCSKMSNRDNEPMCNSQFAAVKIKK